ncbi:hypothetical protein L9F63_002400, partial [Diploptera punctata]
KEPDRNIRNIGLLFAPLSFNMKGKKSTTSAAATNDQDRIIHNSNSSNNIKHIKTMIWNVERLKNIQLRRNMHKWLLR